MEEIIYYSELYDLYGLLLTDKQREYFENYYFNNLSLGEMAENYNVSRNAIHKQLKIAISKLEEYEEKLKLHVKLRKLNEAIQKISDQEIKKEIENIFTEYEE